jgi:putative ABC transport system substrate-binding protein
MKRRTFIAGIAGAAAVTARAQQAAVPVIGYLSPQFADDEYKNFAVLFLQALKETGYVDGQNVAVEYRYAENQFDRLPALAADLVRRRVAVIVAVGAAAALAAKATTIPIAFISGADPVAIGLVASLNRPGANLTGAAILDHDLVPKQLQLLREVIPSAAVFGVLVDPAFPPTQLTIADFIRRHANWDCSSLLRMQEPTAISKWPSKLFPNSMLVRSWSATVTSTPRERNNSRRWWRAMRYPRSSHTVSSPWPAA